MTGARVISLPHGVIAGGQVQRAVTLRAPTGADELELLDADGRTRAQLASRLLERCVRSIGSSPATPERIGALVAGDREALLLHMRAAAFGDRLACLLDCPECGEPMDLDLSVGDLLVESYADPRAEYTTTLADGTPARFRLPAGADLEAAADTRDPEAGARALLERCVSAPSSLAPDAVSELADEMERLDPQAELMLAMTCPECAGDVTAVLDAASLLLDELAGDSDALLADVHTIALHYHWGEGEILALELPRRRRYLELLAGAPS